ncbi:MAG TPA: pyruvate formate lyase family protein [Erysipelotrichaceae bacterium]|nr:pyruvate formate lyase family protein [Erysipelotrichaceae bacterium]HQA85480.1 pyruvate formate lyase family protein [Erysipelotrichaceae bacterium]
MENLRDYIFNLRHQKYRKKVDEIAQNYHNLALSDKERVVRRFEYMCENEEAVILNNQQIVFMRTINNLPDCFTKEEWSEKFKNHYIHESGYVSNLLPDYTSIIQEGLLKVKERSDTYLKREIDALLKLTDKYLIEAKKLGRNDVVETLSVVPRYPALNLKQAMQFFRILHYGYMLEGGYQIVGGRIDQLFYPYLKKDMEEKILDENSALELIKDFFLSFNVDADLYDGVQQGDNGQSVVLGGIDEKGNQLFNLFSKLSLIACRQNNLIDPKINLRVNKDTPIEIFELGSELTKAGLGFPQYLNDDVIIESLIRQGYKKEDAYNYAVAACWEIVIPKYGFEIVNIGACCFFKVLEDLLKNKTDYQSFSQLLTDYKVYLEKECDSLLKQYQNIYFVPAPLIESGLEVKYQNFGIHGTGISTITDSLYSIKKLVFDDKKLSLKEFVSIINNNYENHDELFHHIKYQLPKMGQNNDEVDEIAVEVLEMFYDTLKDKRNCYGGIIRPGTGTAMYYLWHGKQLGASYDGRKKSEPLSANYSPSLSTNIKGPISIIESFCKPDLIKCNNGGPLTLEFSSSMFNDDESIKKMANFIKLFVLKKGHQLQCNSVNLHNLKNAQINPDKYRNLIVRIWGWSAYFVELDKEYQDHVIARQEHSL